MPMTVYLKTELGRQALKTRSAALTQRQRSAFILFDGVRTVDQVLAATAGLGLTPEDVTAMVAHGYLASPPEAASAAAADALPAALAVAEHSPQNSPVDPVSEAAPRVTLSPQERYMRAYPLATQLTASLGLRGFRLNLAVEAASNCEQLLALATRIREAVGPEKCRPLDEALGDQP